NGSNAEGRLSGGAAARLDIVRLVHVRRPHGAVLAQGCLVRRRLTIDALSNGRSLSEKDLLTNSVSKTLRDCLCFCPEYRTKEMRQKILWFLRTNKVYTHLFSSEMEEECTKYVFYEKYQDGRILSLVDRVPEKFYYVISGKKRKTYELRSGDYDRVFSVITKGQTSDDRVILDDITDTPYIHVIKSGSAKVIRKQLVVHYPRNKYSRDRVIGYSKLGSHSTDMQGLTQRQRQFKAEQQPPELELPRLQGSGNPLAHTIGLVQREQQKSSLSRDPKKKTLKSGGNSSSKKLPKLQTAAMPTATSALSNETSTAAPAAQPADEHDSPGAEDSAAQRGSIRTGPASVETAVRPQSRRRAAAAARVLLGPEGFPPERPQREAYVVLDTLTNGDFLDKKNVLSLLSDGAEIILINKRFFVQNAANNTLLKAETMARDFASKSEASQSIEAKEDWEMFRAAFVQRMAANNRQARQERQARIFNRQRSRPTAAKLCTASSNLLAWRPITDDFNLFIAGSCEARVDKSDSKAKQAVTTRRKALAPMVTTKAPIITRRTCRHGSSQRTTPSTSSFPRTYLPANTRLEAALNPMLTQLASTKPAQANSSPTPNRAGPIRRIAVVAATAVAKKATEYPTSLRLNAIPSQQQHVATKQPKQIRALAFAQSGAAVQMKQLTTVSPRIGLEKIALTPSEPGPTVPSSNPAKPFQSKTPNQPSGAHGFQIRWSPGSELLPAAIVDSRIGVAKHVSSQSHVTGRDTRAA
uniref:Cyclic nucleotide-binding domain-containing protein n=1 Tax=Macrostomum lignano TaxID=282301 RepID=A0A1I8HZM3_9PLAT